MMHQVLSRVCCGRFCLSAAHSREQLDRCLDAIEEVVDELGLRYARRPPLPAC